MPLTGGGVKKAVTSKSIPPFTHKLKYLADECNLRDSLTDQQQQLIDDIKDFYIEARYPGEGSVPIQDELTKEQALGMLEQTNNLQQWIKKTILSA